MVLGSFLRKQLVEILQWTEDVDGVLAWRLPLQDAVIQYGARLTVRDSQQAVFVNEGRVADVFGPGLHTLTTRTLPVLTALQHWDKGFESPFKSDVIFFSTRLQLGRRWGTAQPVTLRDSEFGMVRARAHGIYSYQVADVATFYREVVGTRARYTVEDLEAQLRNLVVAGIADTLGNAGGSFLDLAANQALMAEHLQARLKPAFARYGIALEALAVESVSLPDELQRALDTRIAVGMAGDLDRFTRYQAANALPLAARSGGGVAGLEAGLAAGAAVGQAMAHGLAPAPATPPAADDAAVQRLRQLKTLLEQDLITAQDYETAKQDVLRRLTG